MFLKQISKDLFSKNAEKFWKNEGCNNRMQKYLMISKIFRVIQLLLMFLIILYLIVISTISIINISNIANIDDSIKYIINIYEISFIGIIGLNIVHFKIKKQTLEKLIPNIIKSLIVMPIIVLIMFYFELIGNLMLSFWFLVMFMIIDFIINEFNKKVKLLYGVSIGKESINDNNTKIK